MGKRKEALIKVAKNISKWGLKEHSTVLGPQTIDYFRMDNFTEIVLKHGEEIRKPLLEFFPKIPEIKTQKDAVELAQVFAMYKVCGLLERHPQAEDEIKKKWPKKLIPKRDGRANDKIFMTWLIPKDAKRLSLFLILAIIAGLLIMLFPIWPVSIKLVIWYISFYLLVFLVGLIIVRAIVWTAFFIIGFDFWIFPNLLEDTYYILDTFRPFLSWDRRQDGFRMVMVRIATLGSIALLAWQLSNDPETVETFQTGTDEILDDLFEWGNQRFVVGNVANNQTLVDPNAPKSARDVFAEAVFEEM